MSADSMYLVLPANGIGFPENTNHSYKVRLAERLRLDGSKWECALVDCFYSNTWYNIEDAHITVYRVGTSEADSRATLAGYRAVTFKVPSGKYRNLSELVVRVNECIQEVGLSDALTVINVSDQDVVRLTFGDSEHTVVFGDVLARVLGFTANRYYERPSAACQYIDSDSTPDIQQGFTSMFIYCSLVENRLVGDSSVRLLRVLPVRHRTKQHNTYEEVGQKHYIPVTTTDSDIVEINISRDDGTPVTFKGGKVIVTVHLRRVR